MRSYNMVIKAQIEIGGVIEADSAIEAAEILKHELRRGEISNISVEFPDDELMAVHLS